MAEEQNVSTGAQAGGTGGAPDTAATGTAAPAASSPAEKTPEPVKDDTGLGLTAFLKSAPSETKPAEPKPEGDVSPNAETPQSGETEGKEDASKVKGEAPSPKADDAGKPADNYEKRYQDTQKWANKISQENADLKRSFEQQARLIEKMSKQLEGEWTEEDEERFAAVDKGPSPEEIVQHANIQGKVDASRVAAFNIYGEETVAKLLYAEDAPFREIQDDPVVRAKVLSSDAPVITAIKVVKAKQFYDKWGYDPETIEANIRKTVEAELKDKVTQEVMKTFDKKQTLPTTLRDVRGSDAKGEAVVVNAKPLSELFTL